MKLYESLVKQTTWIFQPDSNFQPRSSVWLYAEMLVFTAVFNVNHKLPWRMVQQMKNHPDLISFHLTTAK